MAEKKKKKKTRSGWPGNVIVNSAFTECLSYVKVNAFHSSPRLLLFFFFRATPVVDGRSQAWGQIRAAAAALHHSSGNAGSSTH